MGNPIRTESDTLTYRTNTLRERQRERKKKRGGERGVKKSRISTTREHNSLVKWTLKADAKWY